MKQKQTSQEKQLGKINYLIAFLALSCIVVLGFQKPKTQTEEFKQILFVDENGKVECYKGYCPEMESKTLTIKPKIPLRLNVLDKNEYYHRLSKNPEVVSLFKLYFPKIEEAKIMRAISLAESKGKKIAINRKNRNGSVDSGFFQINTIHRKKGEDKETFVLRMHNLEANFKEARRILDTQGLQAWSTYNDKKYLAFYE